MKWLNILLATLCCIGVGLGSVTMSGSTTVLPLGVALSEAYTLGGVSVSGGGSGAGMQALATGTTDIAMSSRKISSDEKSQIPGAVENLLGYDGLCFITDSTPGVSKLSIDQLKAIYSGSVTNWKQVGGNDQEIIAVSREGGSGTRDTFLELVMGDKKASCDGEKTICMSSAEVLSTVKGTPGAIGYVGYSYTHGVVVVAVNGIMPTQTTIKDKTYPLARSLFLYSKLESSQESKDFISFALSDKGKAVAEENGFIPL